MHKQLSRKDLRRHGRRRRIEQRIRSPEERREHDELPDLERAEHDQGRDHRDRSATGRIGCEHRETARNPVDDHATNQEQKHCRKQPRGKDKRQRDRVVVDTQRLERERDCVDAITDQGDALPGPQQREIAVAERGGRGFQHAT